MQVISNTSPLLNLAIIDHLHLIEQQFGKIIIPQGVLTELRVNENLQGSQELRDAIKKGWIKVREVQNKAFVQLLRRELDLGETEAIALAIEVKADLLLLDEREGRRIARNFNLKITGIIGIILKAWHQKKIVSVKDVINQLRTDAHFHISPKLEQQILQETKSKNLD
jgi:predicted nucleic acid-binding protein